MIGYAGKYRSPCLRAPDGDRATEALAPGLHHPNVGLRRLEERGDGLGDVPQHLFDLERRGDEPVHVVQRLEALGVLLRLAGAGAAPKNGGPAWALFLSPSSPGSDEETSRFTSSSALRRSACSCASR